MSCHTAAISVLYFDIMKSPETAIILISQALNEYNGIIFELTGETTGKMKLYESSGSGSPFREGYEQSNLKGTETYPDGQELIERPLSLTCSLQYNILNN